MKTVYKTTHFKKDFKKYKNQPDKIEKFCKVLTMLVNDETLPKEFKAHRLLGQYKDCLECHLEGDFLLIWIDEDLGVIKLLRLGTHSELFK